MNSQQMMEEIDRLSKMCEAKDAEIARINHAITCIDVQLSEAQAQIEMQAQAMELAQIASCSCLTKTNVISHHSEHCLYRIFGEALSATSETIAAFRAKETEPLRREVAMLRGRLEDYMAAAPELCDDNDENAMRDTQATALAYEREVENRGAVKALEDASEYFAGMFTDSCPQANIEKELQRMAAKLRAADKGESK